MRNDTPLTIRAIGSTIAEGSYQNPGANIPAAIAAADGPTTPPSPSPSDSNSDPDSDSSDDVDREIVPDHAVEIERGNKHCGALGCSNPADVIIAHKHGQRVVCNDCAERTGAPVIARFTDGGDRE